MAGTGKKFICQECGAVYPRLQGQCYHCGAWNSVVEEIEEGRERKNLMGFSPGKIDPTPISGIETTDTDRMKTGIGEFDRVTGGGIVPGSLILIGGNPGIGKSTLLLSVSDSIARRHEKTVLYVTGEESLHQIKIRAKRMGIESDNLLVFPEIELSQILSQITTLKPALVVIDSIQTMIHPGIESAPGSVSQVRECAGLLQQVCKKSGIPIILVGHVTKSGAIAGPMVMEHIVDSVLFFEGENIRDFRILRALKNRFGSTQEIGVFTMEVAGLREVENPSEFFLSHHLRETSGSVVVPVVEGTRTILVEIQALVTKSGFGMPARRATGVPVNRVSVLLAVLEKRAGMLLGGSDVFVNVVGGVQVDEPAIDLGICLAVISSLRDRPMPPATCVVGEIGLGGEVRGISRVENRIRECLKMGFEKIVLPETNVTENLRKNEIQLLKVNTLREAISKSLTSSQ
ncbi:MAG: DNA repair protein RadA [Candidatus Eremiobacteraeota bacterium]|nr:DNA repair protein RadA [Candidatus Eremiobacteraeota bacterium]